VPRLPVSRDSRTPPDAGIRWPAPGRPWRGGLAVSRLRPARDRRRSLSL